MKTFQNPPDIHAPLGSYTHQVELKGSERMLILSGQVGMTPDGTIPQDPMEQLDLAMENIIHNLKAAGMEVSDLVKLTFYLVGEFETTRRRQITAAKLAGHKPCMTTIYAAALAMPALKVEIDAWASKED